MKKIFYFLFAISFLITPLGCSSKDNGNGNGETPKPETAFRVMSYNILNGMKNDPSPNKSTYVNWIKAKNVDVLAVQEINFVETITTPGPIDEEEEFKKQAKRYGHDYVAILKKPGYKNHIGITSKYPIEDIVMVHQGMDHGYIKARINGYNILATHLDPYKYENRRREIKMVLDEIAKSGKSEKWILLGDFNSVTPLDEEKYLTDGNRYLNWLKDREDATHHNLVDGKIDYSIHQAILDSGLKDGLYEFNNKFTYPKDKSGRIDFIYISSDLVKNLSNSLVSR